MQLEEELRAVLRERRLRGATNHIRIKFRQMERGKRSDEAGERKRDMKVEVMEREGRLEGLRRVARRRMGLHLMPQQEDRLAPLSPSSPSASA